jgi:dihydroorotase
VEPANILGLPCGTLTIGSAADICVFDPGQTWLLDARNMFSQGHNTPFSGWEMKGRVTHTLLDGRRVFTLGA